MVVRSGSPGTPGSSAGEAARDLAGQVLDRLRAGGQTVAVAESLTGGLVAAALTDVPGSSAAFRGGVVAYATELKADLLGVDAMMLRRHGAVYPPVAAAMAEGVRAAARRHLRGGHHRRGRARDPPTASRWAPPTSR